MEAIRIPAGVYAANCYILFCKSTNEGIVVDPGGDVEEILEIIKEKNLRVKSILLTHGHGDHIGGVEELKDRLNIPMLIHKDEVDMLKDPDFNLSSTMAMDPVSLSPDKTLEEGDIIEFGNVKGEVIHTPGHTQGGICVKFKEYLITGDTLFKGSVGRSDLRGGNHTSLIKSIKDKLVVLDDELEVLPGHGPRSTILEEKSSNPFLK